LSRAAGETPARQSFLACRPLTSSHYYPLRERTMTIATEDVKGQLDELVQKIDSYRRRL
jgi:hypothetical protein